MLFPKDHRLYFLTSGRAKRVIAGWGPGERRERGRINPRTRSIKVTTKVSKLRAGMALCVRLDSGLAMPPIEGITLSKSLNLYAPFPDL